MNDKTKFDAILLGLNEDHLVPISDESPFLIHKDSAGPFQKLFEEAREDGLDLQLISSFRSFEKQKSIWNRKAKGDIPLLDSNSKPIDYKSSNPTTILWAILKWSALPGMSRHHWGTDLDIVDKKSYPDAGYQVQLIPQEFEEGGPFHPLNLWLSKKIEERQSHGFYRPYQYDQGGVSPEMWHLSHAPVANSIFKELSFELFEELLTRPIYKELELYPLIWEHRLEIFNRFIKNVESYE